MVEPSGDIWVAASTNNPSGIAFDNDGKAYVTSFADHRVYKIASGGVVTPIAGSGSVGFGGEILYTDRAAGHYRFRLGSEGI